MIASVAYDMGTSINKINSMASNSWFSIRVERSMLNPTGPGVYLYEIDPRQYVIERWVGESTVD